MFARTLFPHFLHLIHVFSQHVCFDVLSVHPNSLQSKMLKYLTSIGADSTFEKNRLMLTSRNLEAPDEHAIKRVLKTFQGEDDETRSQIAFATIIKKISTSDSNDNWIYLLKNLIILDRVVCEQCFSHQIADLQIPVIEQYVQKNSRYIALRTDAIIRNYWKLIKFTAKLLKNRRHISYFPRSQRSEFLNTLTPRQIMQQMETLNQYLQQTFVVANSITSTRDVSESVGKAINNFKKQGLISYILLQLLYKLIAFYSSQMLCVNKIVSVMAKDVNMELLSLQEVRKFRHLLTIFKQESGQIIDFVQKNKDIKGFEVVNYRDLDPMPGNSIIKSIDQYISQRLNKEDDAHNVHSYISQSNIELTVRHKPRISGQENCYQPRKLIDAHQSQILNNPFQNFISSFSEDFPQKQMMTIDLIIAIKQQKQRQECLQRGTNYEQVIKYDERETCVVRNHDTLPDHLHFTMEEQESPTEKCKNVNIYSDLPSVWNFQ